MKGQTDQELGRRLRDVLTALEVRGKWLVLPQEAEQRLADAIGCLREHVDGGRKPSVRGCDRMLRCIETVQAALVGDRPVWTTMELLRGDVATVKWALRRRRHDAARAHEERMREAESAAARAAHRSWDRLVEAIHEADVRAWPGEGTDVAR